MHVEARRYAKQGCKILLIGHAGHDEVEGTFGEAPEAITIVESPADVEATNFAADDQLVYLTQTTLSIDDANVIIDAIKQKYPHCKAPPKEDICYATTNRQNAVRQLAKDADLTLVVGSTNSSNSVRLTEISQTDGTPAKLLDDKSELCEEWFKGVETVLVTAGASAPDDLVQEIVQELTDRFGGIVQESEIVDEGMQFALPVTLRVMKHEMSQ